MVPEDVQLMIESFDDSTMAAPRAVTSSSCWSDSVSRLRWLASSTISRGPRIGASGRDWSAYDSRTRSLRAMIGLEIRRESTMPAAITTTMNVNPIARLLRLVPWAACNAWLRSAPA